MTGEIIINGIDVSGCDFLLKEDDYCSYSGEYRGYKGQCGCSDEEMCKDHPNCFYKEVLKQLKRKEQECKELKKKQRKLEVSKELYDSYCKTHCGANNIAINLLKEFSFIKKQQIIPIIQEGIRILRFKRDKYKQALDEIESLCKNEACAPCKELEENDHCDECHGKIILDIINKAKEK